MVTHTLNLCSAINPSKVHTHSNEHTHTPWTHTRSSGQPFMLWRPGSSWGFSALLKGTSVMVLRVERAQYIHSPTNNPCRTWDSNPQPLDYEADSLTIRPRLPPQYITELTVWNTSFLRGLLCVMNKQEVICDFESEKVKVNWHVAKYGYPYSAINPSKVHTHSSEHTHTHTHREHTPGAVGSHLCCGGREAVGGSVSCSRAPQSWYWGWRESAVHSPPPTIPAGPRLELETFGLLVRLSNH